MLPPSGDAPFLCKFRIQVLFPTLTLVVLSFISFFMDENALGDRMSITLTILLTLVALKITVSQ